MAAKSAIVARIAMNLVGVTGINAVYAPTTATGVLAVPEEIHQSLPCALLLAGEHPVIPGNWERQTWRLNGSVWTNNAPRAERYQQLTDLAELILAAFRVPDTTAVDPAVQSVLLTSFDPIGGQQWQRGDNAPWYLVLPFTLEVKVNRSVTYGPA